MLDPSCESPVELRRAVRTGVPSMMVVVAGASRSSGVQERGLVPRIGEGVQQVEHDDRRVLGESDGRKRNRALQLGQLLDVSIAPRPRRRSPRTALTRSSQLRARAARRTCDTRAASSGVARSAARRCRRAPRRDPCRRCPRGRRGRQPSRFRRAADARRPARARTPGQGVRPGSRRAVDDPGSDRSRQRGCPARTPTVSGPTR